MRYLVNRNSLWNQMDNLMNGFAGTGATEAKSSRTPAVDILEEESRYLIEAELPGISEKDVEVKVEENLLTLSAERKSEKDDKKEAYLRKERSSWSFKRSFVLPRNVSGKDIKASFENGVLSLELPKKEEAKPLTIEVKKSK